MAEILWNVSIGLYIGAGFFFFIAIFVWFKFEVKTAIDYFRGKSIKTNRKLKKEQVQKQVDIADQFFENMQNQSMTENNSEAITENMDKENEKNIEMESVHPDTTYWGDINSLQNSKPLGSKNFILLEEIILIHTLETIQ